MKSVRSLMSALILSGSALAALPAGAATITGGTTAVTLTSAPSLASLGLSVSPTGTATVATDASGLPVVTFPITGGTTAGGNAIIEHNGSGLLFSNGGGATLGIGNFRIDTAAALITGDASANGSALGIVPLFKLAPGAQLLLTAEAAGAFQTVFNADVVENTIVGTAAVNPIAAGVPEPATWSLMILGFGAVGAAMRRRTRGRVRFAHA